MTKSSASQASVIITCIEEQVTETLATKLELYILHLFYAINLFKKTKIILNTADKNTCKRKNAAGYQKYLLQKQVGHSSLRKFAT